MKKKPQCGFNNSVKLYMNKMEEENTQIPKKTITRKCSHCHQDVKVDIGLSGDNFKRLFRKPTIEEWVTLFIMIMVITSFFVYRSDINAYETYIKTNCTCTQDYNQQGWNPNIKIPTFNIIKTDPGVDNDKENNESG